jgi:hypothetical protein
MYAPSLSLAFLFFVFLFPLKKKELGLGVTFQHTYTSHATITGMRGPRSSPDLKQFSGFPKSVVKWERVKKCRILSHQVHNSTQASGTENAPKSTNTVITEGQCNWRSHKKKKGPLTSNVIDAVLFWWVHENTHQWSNPNPLCKLKIREYLSSWMPFYLPQLVAGRKKNLIHNNRKQS